MRFWRFTAEFAEPDPEGGSILGGRRRGKAGVRAGELRRACLGDPLTCWRGMLTVYVAVTNDYGHATKDAGGGFRAVDCVPRRVGSNGAAIDALINGC